MGPVPPVPKLPLTPYSQTFYHFSANFVYVLLGCWLFAQITRAVLFVTSERFCNLSEFHRRNVITYVLEVPFETLQLVLAVGWGFPALTESASPDDVKITSVNLLLLVCLYLFELIYRVQTRWPLLAHHVLAIGLCILVVLFYEHTGDQRAIGIGTLVLLTAITEQPSFVALYFYRMTSKEKLTMWLMRFSAIQTVVFKTAFMVTAITYISIMLWSSPKEPLSWYHGYSAVAYGMLPGLLFTQFYAGWILWTIGNKRRRQGKPAQVDDSQERVDNPAPEPSGRVQDGISPWLSDTAPTSVEATAVATMLAVQSGIRRMTRVGEALGVHRGTARASMAKSTSEDTQAVDIPVWLRSPSVSKPSGEPAALTSDGHPAVTFSNTLLPESMFELSSDVAVIRRARATTSLAPNVPSSSNARRISAYASPSAGTTTHNQNPLYYEGSSGNSIGHAL
eukprot:TRINITY_DN8108_c0_g1_i1.p1 TRINITY_DN8108_c0_g1~~TRINITY_DN8108_c0_g1_i1.p1  ORF type:complete len:451 (-),score=119.60 TRINITY_DN8108_c0_g1_i1:578-1930(-)